MAEEEQRLDVGCSDQERSLPQGYLGSLCSQRRHATRNARRASQSEDCLSESEYRAADRGGTRSCICKAPSTWTQYKTLLAKDLKTEFRTKDMIVSMGIYAFLVIVVFGVALSFARPGSEFLEVSGGLLWGARGVHVASGAQPLVFQGDGERLLGRPASGSARPRRDLSGQGDVEFGVFGIGGSDRRAAVLGVLLQLRGAGRYGWLLVVPLVAGSIGIAGIGTMLSTITAATRGKDVILALLFVPVIFPLLYACVSATTCALVGGDVFADGFLTSLALGAGYDVIMILASWVLYDFVVN